MAQLVPYSAACGRATGVRAGCRLLVSILLDVVTSGRRLSTARHPHRPGLGRGPAGRRALPEHLRHALGGLSHARSRDGGAVMAQRVPAIEKLGRRAAHRRRDRPPLRAAGRRHAAADRGGGQHPHPGRQPRLRPHLRGRRGPAARRRGGRGVRLRGGRHRVDRAVRAPGRAFARRSSRWATWSAATPRRPTCRRASRRSSRCSSATLIAESLSLLTPVPVRARGAPGLSRRPLGRPAAGPRYAAGRAALPGARAGG